MITERGKTAGKKVFVSWSGGKDSYLSLIKARAAGLEVCSLVTFINQYQAGSMSHAIPPLLLHRQSCALGIPLLLEPVTWGSYEKGFQRAVGKLKEKGIDGGVFGDINILGHRQWVEKACSEAGIEPCLPLWGMTEAGVVAKLLELKAELLIAAVRPDQVDVKWLGQILGREFIRELAAGGISPCGEGGEYHTLVLNGPLFREKIAVILAGIYRHGPMQYLAYHDN